METTTTAKVARRDRAAMSPFRYPGGKAFFADHLRNVIERLPGGTTRYLEPYAGGAGAALRLLGVDAVDVVHLNDADPRVFHAWRSLLHETERFIDEIANVPVTIETWYRQKAIINNPEGHDSFALGFATFFMNRTNRSGIVQGAGPIGGLEQKGDWRLDVRFNRDAVIERVSWLGSQRTRIVLSNLDGLEFVKRTSNDVDLARSLYFIDPPYVAAGARLYMNGMRERDHRVLGAYLCSGIIPNWIVTYDDCRLIRECYAGANIDRLDVMYSLQRKRTEGEVLITPNLRPPLL